jgi:hypothetical protein
MNLIIKSVLIALATFTGRPVLSQPWYHPTEGVDSAFLQNTSNDTVDLWLTGPSMNGQFQEEINIELAPNESKQVSLKDLPAAWPYFTFKSYEQLPVKIFLQENKSIFSLTAGRGDTLSIPLRATFKSSRIEPATLTITNLIPFGQDGRIRIFSLGNLENIIPFSLNAHESIKVPISINGATKVQIEGAYALAAHLSAKDLEVAGVPVRSLASLNPSTEGVYFLMSSPDQTESYIFQTTNDAIIKEAREQILGLTYKRPLVARVQLGHGNMNRNLNSSLKTTWSWSVSEALRFADLVSQDCDGSPQILEDFLSWWMNKPQPVICFWNYKIEKEVTPLQFSRP